MNGILPYLTSPLTEIYSLSKLLRPFTRLTPLSFALAALEDLQKVLPVKLSLPSQLKMGIYFDAKYVPSWIICSLPTIVISSSSSFFHCCLVGEVSSNGFSSEPPGPRAPWRWRRDTESSFGTNALIIEFELRYGCFPFTTWYYLSQLISPWEVCLELCHAMRPRHHHH